MWSKQSLEEQKAVFSGKHDIVEHRTGPHGNNSIEKRRTGFVYRLQMFFRDRIRNTEK